MNSPKIICVSPYTPRQCGIANYTKDLVGSMKKVNRKAEIEVAAIHDANLPLHYPREVKLNINYDDIYSYINLAKEINAGNHEFAILEHEFGLYGGKDGSHILGLTDNLDKPYIITFHTVLSHPDANKARIVRSLAKKASAVVVMADEAVRRLDKIYGVDISKIHKIPHGVPNIPFGKESEAKAALGLSGRKVISTFGLISQNKGIEFVIEAIPKIAEKFPEVLFLVIGKTHPVVRRSQGESYRESLKALTKKCHAENNVRFVNRYLTFKDLIEYLTATDIYITPYLESQQITSGTLAYALGAGKACISTPYAYASEVLSSSRGCLVPFKDSVKIADQVSQLFSDNEFKETISKRGYNYSRSMLWENVAKQHLNIFDDISNSNFGNNI